MNQPQTHEYPAWGQNYISQVDGDVVTILQEQATTFPSFLHPLVEKSDYAYAPGKWTLKELVGHIIDTERIMVYRLLCFARGETASLPGFEENEYVANAHFKDSNLLNMAEEFSLMRKSHIFLISSFNEEELSRLGLANGKQISVRAIIYVLTGHIIHHTKIIKERYL